MCSYITGNRKIGSCQGLIQLQINRCDVKIIFKKRTEKKEMSNKDNKNYKNILIVINARTKFGLG